MGFECEKCSILDICILIGMCGGMCNVHRQRITIWCCYHKMHAIDSDYSVVPLFWIACTKPVEFRCEHNFWNFQHSIDLLYYSRELHEWCGIDTFAIIVDWIEWSRERERQKVCIYYDTHTETFHRIIYANRLSSWNSEIVFYLKNLGHSLIATNQIL